MNKHIADNGVFTGFNNDLFAFLRELKENNTREWFLANKQRYERVVRRPLQVFIAEFGEHLKKISKHYIADPKPVGGSLFRIYRDVRFSKDKSPYKTHAGVQFRHERGKDVHAPGFYLHLEPGTVFAAAGVWKPDSILLGKIRDAIVEKSDQWLKIFANKNFSDIYNLAGDSLKRPPRGYDPEHPLIIDLKRKDIFIMTSFSEELACSKDFIKKYADICRISAPFMAFLTEAAELPFT